jgi:High potential iron-sulfur protein
MTASRRSFLVLSLGASASLALSRFSAAGGAELSESDPAAQKLGYKQDASTVDKAKFTNYSAGQECSTCSLYQGKTGEPLGGCTLFGTKLVAEHGWCSSYSNF